MLGSLPADLFHTEVLKRLGPRALASLAGASHGCAAAVSATALMQWAERAKRAALGHFYLLPLCLEQACSYAAHDGNRVVLEWLHNTGCPWVAATCAAAAYGGHLAVLQGAREHHCPWNSLTSSYAASNGHLRVLQWAREHHCPWDSNTCAYAAINGQLEVLQWVREHDATGEVWNEDLVRRYALGPRKQEVLTWLTGISRP